MARVGWVRAKALTAGRKVEIAAACARVKARRLPGIRPTAGNDPVDILGCWRGESHSLVVRFRSGCPETAVDPSFEEALGTVAVGGVLSLPI